MHDERFLVYLDEAHIHQDADLGYGWSVCGERLWVCSSSPGLSAKVSCYGLYLYNEAQVEIWPYPRANGDHTVEVLERLRSRCAQRPIYLLWDGASYHRSAKVRQRAAELAITLIPLPAYSPDFMPVEAADPMARSPPTFPTLSGLAGVAIVMPPRRRLPCDEHLVAITTLPLGKIERLIGPLDQPVLVEPPTGY